MNVDDVELVTLLEQRDGRMPERSWDHASEGDCRYSELYDGAECPWCAAVRRRNETQSGSTANN